jgi:hypothetical protein
VVLDVEGDLREWTQVFASVTECQYCLHVCRRKYENEKIVVCYSLNILQVPTVNTEVEGFLWNKQELVYF